MSRSVFQCRGVEFASPRVEAECALALLRNAMIEVDPAGGERVRSVVDGWIHGWAENPAILEALEQSLGRQSLLVAIFVALSGARGIWSIQEYQREVCDVVGAVANSPFDLRRVRPLLFHFGRVIAGDVECSAGPCDWRSEALLRMGS